ncbi:MAG TPA: BlaI/MecI/CopY family transcriptional regulator [Gemmatimonadaceae bacterium]|jgi:predicted transcriptional regulator|nr:BlaI/MecI/CopY family transcriptional regulator [Gemmatimonadaceae bacterium]
MTTPIPSNAELEILRILWRRGPSTVRDVHDELKGERDVGYTTVLKIMQVMAEKKLVTRDESERSHVYNPAVEEKSVKRRLVSELLDKAFDGSAAQLVMQALSDKRASPEDLRKIRKLLDESSRKPL